MQCFEAMISHCQTRDWKMCVQLGMAQFFFNNNWSKHSYVLGYVSFLLLLKLMITDEWIKKTQIYYLKTLEV